MSFKGAGRQIFLHQSMTVASYLDMAEYWQGLHCTILHMGHDTIIQHS